MESRNTFLELGNGTKVLPRGRTITVPVVTAGYSMKTDLAVCSLLYGVDLVLGMTWLVEANPLIRWSIGTVYLLHSVSSFQRIMGEWLNNQVKVGTVKVLIIAEELESLRKPSNTASWKIVKSTTFLALWSTETQNS